MTYSERLNGSNGVAKPDSLGHTFALSIERQDQVYALEQRFRPVLGKTEVARLARLRTAPRERGSFAETGRKLPPVVVGKKL